MDSEQWVRELLWMDGSMQSKVWEIRGSDIRHRGRLGLIATGKNELGLHLMLGEVCMDGTHRIKTAAELNGHRRETGLAQVDNLPYPSTWAWHCAERRVYEEPVLIFTKGQKVVDFSKPSGYIKSYLASIVDQLPEGITHELRLQLAYCSDRLGSTRHVKARSLLMRGCLASVNGPYVAVSNVAPMCLGLFADRRYKRKELMTTYGGCEGRPDPAAGERTHARNVRGRVVLDGTDWAKHFRIGLTPNDFEEQARLSAGERTRYLPQSGCPALDFVISHTGIGYMCNAKEGENNVSISYVRHGVRTASVPYDDVAALVCKRDIARHEEIFSLYAFKVAGSVMNNFPVNSSDA